MSSEPNRKIARIRPAKGDRPADKLRIGGVVLSFANLTQKLEIVVESDGTQVVRVEKEGGSCVQSK